MLRTIATLSLVGALSVPTPAAALDLTGIELGLDTGRISVDDNNFRVFDDGLEALTSSGLRVSLPMDDRLSIVGSIAHGARGATAEIYTDDSDDGWEEESGELRAAIYNDRLSAGARYRVWGERVQVYGTAQAHALRAVVRLDDDDVHDDNVTQLERAALTAGASADLGVSMTMPVDLVPRMGALTVTPLGWVEMGYDLFLPSQFEDLGKLNLSGVSMRLGVGIQF